MNMPVNAPQNALPMCWQRWVRCIEDIPCAAYVMRNDDDLTLLAGNQAFYTLLGCSEMDMRLKYGGRLAALLDGDALKPFGSMAAGTASEPVLCQQQLKRSNGCAWLQTVIRACGTESGTVLCCTAMDVTAYELQRRTLTSFEETIRVAAAYAGVDYFEYDFDSRIATIRSACTILPEWLTEETGLCPDFLDKLASEQLILPQYKSLLRETFQSIRQGENKATCEVQLKNSKGIVWARITLALKQGDNQAAGLIEDITQEKEAMQSFLNETQFYQAMLSEKTAFAQIDVTEDRITRIGGMWNLYNEIIHQVTYSELIEKFINKVVHPEDRKHYLEVMQRTNFIESLDNGIDRLGCEFRRIVDQNKMMWMELGIRLFRNPLTQHVHGLLTIQNIDEQKKRETLFRASQISQPVNRLADKDVVSERRQSFDSFLSEQGDIAYLVDPNSFELLYGNKSFYDRIGMTEVQCAGHKCYELMLKRNTPCPFCGRANWTTDKFYLWRNLNPVLEQEFLIKNKLVEWDGQELLLAIAVDISNNKSIVDSMENGSMETHSILSGVQRMAEASTLTASMNGAMETISSFFRADTVRLWRYQDQMGTYNSIYSWTHSGKDTVSGSDREKTSAWLEAQRWNRSITLESPEAMLGYSYDMYQYMKKNNIRNQRWIWIKENDENLGCISIDNLSSNLQNVAFLESFSMFLARELKKRCVIENALYAVRYDDLTGLLSRDSFEEFLQDYQPDQVACIGVVMANINSLKDINSSRGFHTGNHYIKQFANMLREAFHSQAAFRLNGDEFLVVLSGIPRPAAEEEIDRLEELIAKEDFFSVSMGFAWDNVENDLTILIDQATQAMKVNKKRHHDATPSSVDAERRKMLSNLVASIENREFEVFLQPKVELVHGTIVGAEALIRYHHKEYGYIMPSMFIEMLEKNNLIRYIDLFVFEEVCRQLEKWKKERLFLPLISLNFSRLTLLERDILPSMEAIISRYDVSRQYVEIEITESIASMGKSVLYRVTQNICQAGYAISLDDFGTKYTNLAILADLDLSMIKVDKSLVGMLGRGRNHELIMKHLISMCQDLGIDVLAEGIETKRQEKILQSMECKLGQGYLYGRPMSIDSFTSKHIRTRPAHTWN